jgi:hypothetical protein
MSVVRGAPWLRGNSRRAVAAGDAGGRNHQRRIAGNGGCIAKDCRPEELNESSYVEGQNLTLEYR